MALIDKDKALDAISMYLFVNDAVRNDVKVGDYRVFAKSMICDVPEVDIVRCKECKWFKQSESFCENGNGLWQAGVNCFCSYGERSEAEQTEPETDCSWR